jgi:hypothetical protein
MIQNILLEVTNFPRMIKYIRIGEKKLFTIVFNFMIFCLSVFFGLQVGKLFVNGSIIQGFLTAPRILETTTTQNTNQRNILVIGVDRLNTQNSQNYSRLESLWRVSYSRGNPTIVFTPIFPTSEQDNQISSDILQEVFSLNLDGSLGKEFLKYIEQNQIFWNSYVILDEISMIEIIDIIGCPDKRNCELNGALTLGDIPRPWEDKIASAQGQMDLVKKLCFQTVNLSEPAIVGRILGLIPRHLRTDLDTAQLLADVKELQELSSTANSIKCQLPQSPLSISSQSVQYTP